MIIYVVSLFMTLIIAYCCGHIRIKVNDYTDKNKNNIIFHTICSGIPLFVISAFRYNVGTDYQGYLRDILWTRLNATFFVEPFFKFLYKGIVKYNLNEQWFFIITSGLIVFTFIYYVFRESPMPILSIFLFWGTTYYFCSMNGIRQFLAIAVLLLSLKYVEERQLVKFLTFIALAACIHLSSVVFIVIYFLGKIKITPRRAYTITAILLLLSNPITQLVLKLVSYTRYGRYIGTVFDNGQGNTYRMAIQIAILIFCSVFYVDNPKFNIYYNLQIITVWIYAFAGKIVLIRRFAWTFGASAIVLISMAVAFVKDKKLKFICELSIVVLFFAYAFLSTIWGIQGCYPYQFIWER